MTKLAPTRIWWTAADIAAVGLPDMPTTRQGVDAHALRAGWRSDPDHARKRAGKGGGWEYHWRLLPMRAQRAVLAEDAVATPLTTKNGSDGWAWFDALPEKAKQEARRRLLILQKVEALAPASTKFVAAHAVAREDKVSVRTIWSWFAMVEGIPASDRLAHLAPRHRAGNMKGRKAPIATEVFDRIRADYLRLAGPSFSSCYRRVARVAAENGWTMPEEKTLWRHFNAAVSMPTQVLCRKGVDALKRMYPPQVRDKTALRPLEVVNADFHKFDVFVRWPQERGQNAPPTVCRPQMVAFQDVFSGRILAWRIDQTPNAMAVRLAAGDMIESYGIPEHILLDNGREFAAKALTGGAPTRYRFKVREDDVPGLFVTLGCEIHWATPYAGQSKPIERAFRDMCDAIAKDPRFDGAYTGNRTDAKPEDYGSRAVDLEEFLGVLAAGIEEHNSRRGRRSEVAWGRSFAEVFDEAYATAPIRRATEAQRRLWLMGAEDLRTDSRTGMIRFLDNQYWAPWLHEHLGARVIARFDPAALHDGVHVYSAENGYLGHAPCQEKAGFLSLEDARSHARARRQWMNAEKAAAAAHRHLTALELGRELDATAFEPAPDVEAKIVRPLFGAARVPEAPRSLPDDHEPAEHAAVVADLAARRAAKPTDAEDGRERFRRALELERAIEAGNQATDEQRQWLRVYQDTPEYFAERLIWEDFGDAMFR